MFLDTSGLLCYHSKDEPEHREAQRLFKGERRHLTHSYVLAEFVALAQVIGPSFQEPHKSRLLKVMVGSQGLVQAVLLHDDEARTVHQAPRLVGTRLPKVPRGVL